MNENSRVNMEQILIEKASAVHRAALSAAHLERLKAAGAKMIEAHEVEVRRLRDHLEKERERADAAEAALEDMLEDEADDLDDFGAQIVIHIAGDLVIEALI